MKPIKHYSSEQIIAMCPKLPQSTLTEQEKRQFRALRTANEQVGNKYDKIEMTMQYEKFANENEETEMFVFLMSKLK